MSWTSTHSAFLPWLSSTCLPIHENTIFLLCCHTALCMTGQLDNLTNHLGDIHQPWCHFGCLCPEEPHHIFVQCRAFASLWLSYSKCLTTVAIDIFWDAGLSPNDLMFVMKQVFWWLRCLALSSNSLLSQDWSQITPSSSPWPYLACTLYSALSQNKHTTRRLHLGSCLSQKLGYQGSATTPVEAIAVMPAIHYHFTCSFF